MAAGRFIVCFGAPVVGLPNFSGGPGFEGEAVLIDKSQRQVWTPSGRRPQVSSHGIGGNESYLRLIAERQCILNFREPDSAPRQSHPNPKNATKMGKAAKSRILITIAGPRFTINLP